MIDRARTAPWSALLLAAGVMTAGSSLAGAQEAAVGVAAAPDAGATVAVLQVTPGIYMVTVDGLNVAVQVGPDGAVVVDTGTAAMSARLLATVRKLSSQPIRYIVDTSGDTDLIGGNATLAAAGSSLMQNALQRPPDTVVDTHVGRYASIVARDSVLTRMVADTAARYPVWALPAETYTRPEYDFFMNGEPVSVIWQPAAHSDGDSVVRFQHSDVVVAGDIFDDTRFPVIDLQHGGSIDGEFDALNQLLNKLTFAPAPVVTNTGGTLVIPVHGPVCDQADVLTYRDMVGTVRERVRSLISQGKSFRQILAADPAQGYRSRYGADTGSWTTDDFVQAVYQSLMAEKAQHGRKR